MRRTPLLPKLLVAPTLATMLLLLPTVSAQDGAATGEGQPPARGEQDVEKAVKIDCEGEQCKVLESMEQTKQSEEQTKQSEERTKQVENGNEHKGDGQLPTIDCQTPEKCQAYEKMYESMKRTEQVKNENEHKTKQVFRKSRDENLQTVLSVLILSLAAYFVARSAFKNGKTQEKLSNLEGRIKTLERPNQKRAESSKSTSQGREESLKPPEHNGDRPESANG